MKHVALIIATLFAFSSNAFANPDNWKSEWPETNFSLYSVDFGDIISGGPPKDGIPPIDNPQFGKVSTIENISDTEPVIGITINGDTKAYPLSILIWHEIVNDEIGGVPVAVTFCPLCNAAIAFDRRVDGQVLDFGTTGKLRMSDLIMWDRQSESWWQQFLGEAIVGEMTGKKLSILPARLESFANFKARTNDDALVLIANDPNMRSYGANPYAGYDSGRPFLYDGEVPDGIRPLERVVSLIDKSEAWSMSLLQQKGQITTKDGTVISWSPGQNSALDTRDISKGKDVGNITAIKEGKDIIYFVDFAFAFHAFKPNTPIHMVQ